MNYISQNLNLYIRFVNIFIKTKKSYKHEIICTLVVFIKEGKKRYDNMRVYYNLKILHIQTLYIFKHIVHKEIM